MLIEDIQKICINMVRASVFDKKNSWKRLNTFAVVQDINSFNGMGCLNDSGDPCQYHVRGSKPGDPVSRKNGILAWESTEPVYESPKSKALCENISLTIAFREEDCKCPRSKRVSNYEIIRYARTCLKAFIDELCKYCKYAIKYINGGSFADVLGTQSQIDEMISDGVIYPNVRCCEKLEGIIQNEEMVIYQHWNLSSYGYAGVTANLKFCGCENQEEIKFDYSNADCESSTGVITCPCND